MSIEARTIIKRVLPFARPIVIGLRHRVSKFSVKRLLRERNAIFLELGAGAKKGRNGWITIDVSGECDLYWDLRRGIPFPDESVQKLYSSHFFEHLTFKQTGLFLEECKRVLAPHGNFSVCVPNAKLYIDAYVNRTPLDQLNYFGYQRAYNHTTIIDYINYTAYMDGEHKYMFDAENLLFILKSKGFRNVRLRPFDPSLDMKERDFESIYAEADR